MPSNIASALVYLIQAISVIVLVLFLLRLMLPVLRADFRNPIAQAILKITSPVVIPVRRVIPSIGQFDTATLLIIFAIQVVAIWLTLQIWNFHAGLAYIALTALIKIAVLVIRIFTFSIFIRIIISWIAPGQYSPIAGIVTSISEPVLAPFRRIIPPLGGFDLSPILAIILLTALTILVAGLQPLAG